MTRVVVTGAAGFSSGMTCFRKLASSETGRRNPCV
jgi:hypothetical protein